VSEVVELLRELVAIDSVSATSNRALVRVLASRLGAYGCSVREYGYRDPAGVEKVNLVAAAGPAVDPPGAGGLAFLGHTDVVPFDPAWANALVLEERDGRLYGRGTADTKGFLAAVVTAVGRIDRARLVRPLLLVFTADEEIGCVGAKRLVEEVPLRPAQVVVGEPTGLRPVRAHKGYWLAEVEVLGREGHSAYPETGRSAILDAAKLLGRIAVLATELEGDRDEAFVPPYATVNVGTITGGKAQNVIPGACRFPVEWRPLPGRDGEEVARRIRREIEGLREVDPGFRARLEVIRRDEPVAMAPDTPIVRFLEEATGKAAITVPFGTELPEVAALGAGGCVCGPGDIQVAHRTGEYVPREEIEAAVDLFVRAIERFCC
jgi:acetylornithine deacetylase